MYKNNVKDLKNISDKEMLTLYTKGRLHQILNPSGKVDSSRVIKSNLTKQSKMLINALKGVLGPSCSVDDYHYAQAPSELQAYVDRLYYIFLVKRDKETVKGEGYEPDYDIAREDTHLCFYTADKGVYEPQTIVSLIEDTEFKQDVAYALNCFAPQPDIEVAKIPKSKEIRVLDAGIGQSTSILKVRKRLETLGKNVKTHGINLIKMPGVCQLSEPCYVGIFEDFDFPHKFDLIYSNIGSSFYTPSIEKYIDKLLSVMNNSATAILDITNHVEWDQILKSRNAHYTLLKSIPDAELYKYIEGNGDPKFCMYDPGELHIRRGLPYENGIHITGVLIEN